MEALYDQLNPFADDTRFYLGLAADRSARTVIDLGCGTGLFACELATRGCSVIGVDPSPDMLAVARGRPGSERVLWIEGTAGSMPTDAADLVTMMGHVSQVFLTDEAWLQALTEIRRALRPGGVVAFEMRNPAVEPWKRWTRAGSMREATDTDGPVRVWHEVTSVTGDLVHFDTYTHHLRTGRTERVSDVLRFRDEQQLSASLTEAGFDVEATYGDWHGHPVQPGSPELVVIAGGW